MSQVVRDNCAIKAFFTTDTSSKGSELADLQGYSKDETVPRLGTSRTGLRTTTSEQEHEEPKLKRNTIVDVNNTFGEYFLIFKDGKGHSEPLRVMSEFPATKARHSELSDRPLPKKPVPAASTAIVNGNGRPKQRSAKSDPVRGQRLLKLQELLHRLKREEQWKLSA